MSKKAKYYVVWHGVTPGIYTSWDDCLQQTQGFAGPLYKSFDTLAEAEDAQAGSPYEYIERRTTTRKKKEDISNPPSTRTDTVICLPPEVPAEALAVDAACSGNPGPMEYRGVYLRTGETVFHFGPVRGTNNIGEFLALVHGLAMLKKRNLSMPIYSDSRNALLWVKKKKCKTTLERNSSTAELFDKIDRAEKWLRENKITVPLIKWDTKKWGEIPADFGRK